MRPRGGWARILVPVVLVVAATMVPYLWAGSRSSTASVFGGFLLNPQDGFSYLAKMRQGSDGSWLFRLPYAADPGPGVFLFTFYLFLGHVSRVLNVTPLVVYHAARAIGAVCMFLAARALLEELVPEQKGRGWAWAMILVGSGFGWMGLPFGLLALDLWVPEAIPALAAYASAHFPFAIAVLCLAAMAISPGYGGRGAILVAALSGLLLSILQPFAVAVVAVYAAVYLGLDVAAPAEHRQGGDRRRSVLALAAFIGAALPLIVYDALAVQLHPALAAWNRQNLTPSPALLEAALAFLPLLVFSAVAIANSDNRRAPQVRYLAVWSTVTLGLLYAPIGLQRRLALGVYVPLAALGAMAVDAASRWPRWLPILALLLTLPSHAIVVGAGVSSVQQGDPILVLGRDELAAYRWMDDKLPSGSLVLAGPRAGNRIPAYADLRVVYGHPFETPNAAAELAWVQSMYAWSEAPEGALTTLRDRGVAYVYVGPEERGLGEPAWLESLEAVFTEGEVTVYEVAPR